MYKPLSFIKNGFDPYGDNKSEGPLWVRPKSLQACPYKNYPQIVGHTPQDEIITVNNRFYFIDVPHQYLQIDGENIKSMNYNNLTKHNISLYKNSTYVESTISYGRTLSEVDRIGKGMVSNFKDEYNDYKISLCE